MKIYTKTGDDGQTGLFGGPRVFKDDLRIEAYGTLDELNAVIGCLRSYPSEPPIDDWLSAIQNDLFTIGAGLATPPESKAVVPKLQPRRVAALERAIDRLEERLPPLKQFILPGGCDVSAMCHLARVVARRAERRVVSLQRAEPRSVPPVTLRYLNRLSDLLFVLARDFNRAQSVPDVPWQK